VAKFATARRILGWGIAIAAATFALSVGIVAGKVFVWLRGQGVFAITEADLAKVTKSSVDDNTLVFDRSGRRIGELFRRYQVYVPYAELPRPLVEAIIAIEDRNFFRHRGVDYRGMARALWKGLREGRFSQGASTLTQQLVRHFLLDKSKTLKRKVREIAYARRLERQMTKERILELYCNVLFLGNGAYGVGAAAMRYFGRPLGELTLAELAVIAGLFQSPSAYNPERFPERARARQRQVLDAMVAAGYLTRAQAAEAAAAELRYQRYRHLDPHPYFLDAVENLVPKLVERLPARTSAPIAGESMPEEEGGSPLGGLGLRVHSTLDPALQAIAERTIADAPRLWREAQNKVERTKRATVPFEELEAALVAVDPATGEVLALVGGRDYQQSKFNRVTQSLRPPGSAFKPVVYALALQQGRNWNDVFLRRAGDVGDLSASKPDQRLPHRNDAASRVLQIAEHGDRRARDRAGNCADPRTSETARRGDGAATGSGNLAWQFGGYVDGHGSRIRNVRERGNACRLRVRLSHRKPRPHADIPSAPSRRPRRTGALAANRLPNHRGASHGPAVRHRVRVAAPG
jgi:penicillin-binding protein 1A